MSSVEGKEAKVTPVDEKKDDVKDDNVETKLRNLEKMVALLVTRSNKERMITARISEISQKSIFIDCDILLIEQSICKKESYNFIMYPTYNALRESIIKKIATDEKLYMLWNLVSTRVVNSMAIESEYVYIFKDVNNLRLAQSNGLVQSSEMVKIFVIP